MGASQGATQAVLIAAPPPPIVAGAISPLVTLGAGCFWGTEKFVCKDFQKRFPGSIKSASVGFMNPDGNARKDPSYESVCSGTTGYVEVLHLELTDPRKHYEELLRFFFMFHDPTLKNRQGNDVGTQYSSYIFAHDNEQNIIANNTIKELQDKISNGVITSYEGSEMKTKLGKATTYYPADDSHQKYLARNPNGYCNHYMRFKAWPA